MVGPTSARRGPQPGPVGAPRKPRDERWSELLDIATDVLYERGYEAATLQEIADRLGIMKGSLYYYIPSKEALLFEVLRAAHDAGLAVIRAAAEVPGDPLTKLENVIISYVQHNCRNLKKAAVCLDGINKIPQPQQREIIGDDHIFQEVFRDLTQQAQAAGLVRPDVDHRLATLSILGSCNWLYRWFTPRRSGGATKIAHELADLAIRSIATTDVLAQRDSLRSQQVPGGDQLRRSG